MLKLFWSKLIRDKTAIVALTILSFIIIAIIFLPLVYTTPIDMIDFSQSSLPPNWQHPFGTNDLGQDQLARILFGGRVSLTVGITSMIVAISVGTMVGAIAGYYGGVIDNILMRITDICLSLPQLPILLLVIYLFRDPVKSLLGAELGIFSLVVLIIGLLNWMSVARLVRSSFLQIKEREFISAARSLGANSLRIMWQHILPNVINIIIVAATLAVGNGIIVESTLSFLGLGFPPDIPTWGRMLYEAQEYLPTSPHMAIFPGLAIFLTVLSINYLGDKFN
ncbi:ABC transporter permease [Cyanobacterium aponinum UTEX 3222]|uniref:Binding-protein-dependent transport systems inner membrane component n=3 Tax=Cyanobacterium aponinum TaxID=379064 RepID=K9Z1I9_CYAAP|nr:ABC transporter permease [Cyanobacterium aponinum]WRL40374.1 ABC transporter permease [Cyanobacterium aponinum UTEX 3222]AFZ52445.1 binding-protein-dependent transport systems inner membrane component [Cyanobacterium aponinum PCC 10605]MTF37629.1 ABC transporter permease subunit [Cyanobacterium aponinum 0216]PHV61467.1 ABC transporter permease [Cyanobacterium aponinum IPPAS B-1201]WPF87450.1 ABC transporter permease [Cyanobacterium aponinum AL20115]